MDFLDVIDTGTFTRVLFTNLIKGHGTVKVAVLIPELAAYEALDLTVGVCNVTVSVLTEDGGVIAPLLIVLKNHFSVLDSDDCVICEAVKTQVLQIFTLGDSWQTAKKQIVIHAREIQDVLTKQIHFVS